MQLLLVHQNFPGQFKHLAPALVKQGHQVSALLMAQAPSLPWQGVQQHSYWPGRGSSPTIHPWVADLETKVIRAQACLKAARKLAADGLRPDVIVAHPGWGESLFLKSLLKNPPKSAKMGQLPSPDARSPGAQRLPVLLRVD